MNWLWSFLIYGLPWWVQLAIVAVPVLLGFYVAVRVFGWDRVKMWIAPALVLLAALGLASKNRQQGYTDRRAEEEKALDHAEDLVDEKRTDIANDSDAQSNKRFERW